MSRFQLLACALSTAVFLLTGQSPAAAHEKKGIGALQLTIGWGDEPAFSGSKNSIDVDVTDAAGKPVADPGAQLSVEVAFGDERATLPLVPAADRPGRYRAWLVPTRPGTYAFRITGSLKGQAIDTTSTCSEKTFDCVIDVAELQFPAKDPSAGQLAERVGRALPRAERALDTAASARTFGLVAIGLAAAALAAAAGLGRRQGRADP